MAVHLGGDVANPGKHILAPGTRFDFLINGYEANAVLVTPLIDQDQVVTLS